MGTELNNFWDSLFTADGQPTRPVGMRLVRKQGRPFLLLPADPRLARQVLELYPAQTLKARLARAALRCALTLRLPLAGERIRVPVSSTNEFARFLQALADGNDPNLPPFGLLAGNPGSPGQRLILLLFRPDGKPAAVVKAGRTQRAQELIRREITFLDSVPVNLAGVPKLRAALAHPRIHALALDYFPGQSPRPHDETNLPRLLNAWVNPDQAGSMLESRAWSELKNACETQPIFSTLTGKLSRWPVSRTVYHGDFAPWNIKVSRDGNWMAIDWERGEVNGMPGWDWFHYVVQTGVLVMRQPTAKLIERLERLLHSEAFKAYAERSRIRGVERELAVAYLLHQYEVIKPSEGLAPGRALAAELANRWLKP